MITYLTKLPAEPIIIRGSKPQVFVFINCSGELTFDLRSQGSQAYVRALYFLKGNDTHSLRTYQLHTSPNTFSDLLIKGVFDGDSTFSYEGKIIVPPNSHGSNAYQKNQNLLLSRTAVVDTKPYLEIAANDVRCTHGATSGPLSQDALWYLQTRGIDPELGRQILISGFVLDLCSGLEQVLSPNEVSHMNEVLSASLLV